MGTWALEFVAVGRGGWLQKLASYTPTAALHVFEQGQLRINTVVVTVLVGLAGFVLASTWLESRRTLREQLAASLAILLLFAGALWGASRLRASWDLSENRRNSFPRADEAALRRIHDPLRVTVFLAPEDPRLVDLDRNVLSKLAQILPGLEVVYAAHSRLGMFEGPGDHYGEVVYELAGRRVMSRSATEPIVLHTIFELAQVPAPAQEDEQPYAGHPLTARPSGAAMIYYVLWPLVVALGGWLYFKVRS